MKNHFKCIGIVGHPRHPTALTTHEMLWRWLCSKGYEVLVEQQIAHELQLSNVKNRHAGGDWPTGRSRGGGGRRRQYARRGAPWPVTTLTSSALTAATSAFSPTLTRTTPCSSLADVLEGHYIAEKRFCWRPRCASRIARNVSAPPSTKWCCTPAKWRI